MKYCSVFNCPSKGTVKGLSYHKFPTDLSLRAKWINSIPKFKSSCLKINSAIVCGLHFREDDYDYNVDVKPRRLKSASVPSIFSTISRSENSNKEHCAESINGKTVPGIEITNKTAVDIQSGCSLYEPIVRLQEFPESYKFTNVKNTTCHFLNKKSISTQTILYRSEAAIELEKRNVCLNREKHLLSHKIQKLNKRILSLKKEIKVYNTTVNDYKKNKDHLAIDMISNEAKNPENELANIIMEQVRNYKRQRPRWNVQFIRKCASWLSKFPKTYKYVAKEGILRLPSITKLHDFVEKKSAKKTLNPSTMNV